jgi:hypothetical protein
MWHDANNKVGMKALTMALMAKFGVSTIPALVLLDKRGCVICPEACGWVNTDPKGKAFPWREMVEAPMPGLATRAVINFDLLPAEQPKLVVPPAQRRRANRSPSKFLGPKQDPVSTVHSPGGCGGGGERLANSPSPSARPTARVNFDLPPAEQPNQPFPPEKSLPPSQSPNDFFAARATAAPNFELPPTEQPKLLVPPAQRQRANQSPSKFLGPKQDPVSAVHSAGGRSGGGERLANGLSPHARPTAWVNFDLPPAKQPHQPVSPAKILPPSQAPNDFFAVRATAAPKMAPPYHSQAIAQRQCRRDKQWNKQTCMPGHGIGWFSGSLALPKLLPQNYPRTSQTCGSPRRLSHKVS